MSIVKALANGFVLPRNGPSPLRRTSATTSLDPPLVWARMSQLGQTETDLRYEGLARRVTCSKVEAGRTLWFAKKDARTSRYASAFCSMSIR
jgi:hypothetical protein